jgi:hypothetical protein
MPTIEAIVKFLATYPSWAKVAMLLGIALTVGVALLAPRTPIDAEAQSKPGATTATSAQALLRINGVDIRKAQKGTSVRVTAIVNGQAYLYPSLGGVAWLEVGPTMSSQSFQIPQASSYEVRFEMDVNSSDPALSGRHLSQETARVAAIPYTGAYAVYQTKLVQEGITRGSVSLVSVRFSIEPIQ